MNGKYYRKEVPDSEPEEMKEQSRAEIVANQSRNDQFKVSEEENADET